MHTIHKTKRANGTANVRKKEIKGWENVEMNHPCTITISIIRAPFFQNKNTRRKTSCWCELLTTSRQSYATHTCIHTRANTSLLLLVNYMSYRSLTLLQMVEFFFLVSFTLIQAGEISQLFCRYCYTITIKIRIRINHSPFIWLHSTRFLWIAPRVYATVYTRKPNSWM